MSDEAFSELVLQNDPSNKYAQQFKNSSALDRTLLKVNDTFDSAGQSTTDFLGEYVPEFVARGVGDIVRSTPEAVGIVGSSLLGGKSKFLRNAGIGATGLVSGLRSHVETGDKTSSIASAVSVPLSVGLAKLGGAYTQRALAGPLSSKGRKMMAEAVGDFGGGALGDLVEVGFAYTGDPKDNIGERIQKNIEGFVGDPTNIGAYLVAQTPFAALPVVHEASRGIRNKINKRIQTTQSLNETFKSSTEVRDFLHSNGIPTYDSNSFSSLGNIARQIKYDPKNFDRKIAHYRVLSDLESKIGKGAMTEEQVSKLEEYEVHAREKERTSIIDYNKKLLAGEGYEVILSEKGEVTKLLKGGQDASIADAPTKVKDTLNNLKRYLVDPTSVKFDEEVLLQSNINPDITNSDVYKVATGLPDVFLQQDIKGKFKLPTKVDSLQPEFMKAMRNIVKNDKEFESYRHRMYEAAKQLTAKGYVAPETLYGMFAGSKPKRMREIRDQLVPIFKELDIDWRRMTPELYDGMSDTDLNVFFEQLKRSPVNYDQEPLFSPSPDFTEIRQQAYIDSLSVSMPGDYVLDANNPVHAEALSELKTLAGGTVFGREGADTGSVRVIEGAKMPVELVNKYNLKPEDVQGRLFSTPTDTKGYRIANNDKPIIHGYLSKIARIGKANPVYLTKDSKVRGVFEADGTVGVRQTVEGREAYSVLGHELTHLSVRELKNTDPAHYQAVEDYLFNGVDRDMLLRDVKKFTGAEHVDIDYAAGKSFDPQDPSYKYKTTQETVAALGEMLTWQAYGKSKVDPDTNILMKVLPAEFVTFLRQVMTKLKGMLKPGRPNASALLSKDEAGRVASAINLMDKAVFDAEKANEVAWQELKKSSYYDPELWGNSLDMNPKDIVAPAVITGASPEVALYSKNLKEFNSPDTEKLTGLEKHFFDLLSLSRKYDFVQPFAQTMRRFRDSIAERNSEAYYRLGQNPENTLSVDESAEWLENYMDDLTMHPERMQRVSKIFMENQLIRAGKSKRRDAQFTSKEDLLTPEEMRKAGADEHDLRFIKNVNEEMQRVALSDLIDMAETHAYNEGSVILTAMRDKLNPEQAIELSRSFRVAADNVGKAEWMLEQANKSEDPVRIQEAHKRRAETRGALELQIRQSLTQAGYEPTSPVMGKDSLVNLLTAVASENGAYRIKHAATTAKEGYISMMRRGRYIVKAVADDEVEVRGFKTKAEVTNFVNQLDPETNYEIFDKQDAAQRYRYYNLSQIETLSNRYRDKMAEIIDQYASTVPEDTRAVLSQVLEHFDGFRAEEVSKAVAIKGDPSKQERKFVKGFDEMDAIPNLFEHINNRSVASKKQLSAARARFETLDKRIDQVEGLKDKLKGIADYTLNANDRREFNSIRKWTYLWYLGASVRHVVQNATQLPLIGLPKMAADSGSVLKAYKYYYQGIKLASKYAITGKTGDAELDTLIKTADERSLTSPNFLEVNIPDVAKSTMAFANVDELAKNRRTLRQQGSFEALKAGKKFEEVLRSSSEFGEIANRRVSFVMGVLNARAKGVKDLEQIYSIAARHTDEVNFVGDKSNRSGFMVSARNSWTHGPLLASMALRSHMINYISLLSTFWKEGRIGSYDVATKQRNKLDRAGYKPGIRGLATNLPRNALNLKNPSIRALYMALGHSALFAGMLGFLGFEDINELLKAHTGMDAERFVRTKALGFSEMVGLDEATGDKLATAIVRGIPEAMGIGAGSSIGMGNVVGFRQGLDFDYGQLLGGAPGGLAATAFEGASILARDPTDMVNWQEAGRAASPQALRYWQQLADAHYDNQYYDRKGRPQIVGDLDAIDKASLWLGFKPEKARVHQIANYGKKNLLDKRNKDYNQAVERAARAMHDYETTGDERYLQVVRDKVDDFVGEYQWANMESMHQAIRDRARRYSDPRPTSSDVSLDDSHALSTLQQAYPDLPVSSQSSLDALFQDVVSGINTGQIESLARLSKQSIRNAVLRDALAETGLPPQLISLIASMGSSVPQARRVERTLPVLDALTTR